MTRAWSGREARRSVNTSSMRFANAIYGPYSLLAQPRVTLPVYSRKAGDGMTHVSIPLALEGLRHLEATYRDRLRAEPADTRLRLSLAWCLVMQALCEAGQESLAASIHKTSEALREPLAGRVREALSDPVVDERATSHLLHCSLRQASAVMQLSMDPDERSEAENLRALVSRSGASEVVARSDEEAAHTLSEIAEAIVSSRSLPYLNEDRRRHAN